MAFSELSFRNDFSKNYLKIDLGQLDNKVWNKYKKELMDIGKKLKIKFIDINSISKDIILPLMEDIFQ